MTIHYPPTPGSALWVLAHPRAESFSGQLRDAGVKALSATHRVAQSDLYAQGFDPVLSAADMAKPMPAPGVPLAEQTTAPGGWQVPGDVLAEQRKLAEADLLVLQFPLWWYSTPAILKGWLDRVLVDGFAYGDLDPETGLPRRYGEGGLSGRRALVIVTAGDDARTLGPRGVSGDLDSLLFPLTHGTLWYTGVESLDLHVVHDADGLDAAGVQREIERLTSRLAGIDHEAPRRYRSLRDGEYAGTRSLRADLAPERTDLGIHLAG